MGAEFCSDEIRAETDEEAKLEFKKVIKQGRYDYGHAGYTGSFAEKEDVDILPPPKDRNFWTTSELDDKATDISKWENAIGGKVGEGVYYIAGYCSS